MKEPSMSTQSNTPSPVSQQPSAAKRPETQLLELEGQLVVAERRVKELQDARDALLRETHSVEEQAAKLESSGIPFFMIHGQVDPRHARDGVRRRLQDAESILKDAKADRDALELRIERIRNKQDANRSQLVSAVVSILGVAAGVIGAIAALVGVCSTTQQKDLKVTCVPGVSAPAIPTQ